MLSTQGCNSAQLCMPRLVPSWHLPAICIARLGHSVGLLLDAVFITTCLALMRKIPPGQRGMVSNVLRLSLMMGYVTVRASGVERRRTDYHQGNEHTAKDVKGYTRELGWKSGRAKDGAV